MSDKSLKIKDGRFAGFYENKMKANYSDFDELTYVDQYGTLTIPEEYRKLAKIQEYIQFKYEGGKLIIKPVNSKEES